MWVIPQGTEYVKIQISSAPSDCSPRTARPLWIAGKEIKRCTLPIHMSSAETKKGPLPPYYRLCRLAVCTHRLLACLLPPRTALLSHVSKLNKPDSAARMKKAPDVKGNVSNRQEPEHEMQIERVFFVFFPGQKFKNRQPGEIVSPERAVKSHQMPLIQLPVRGFSSNHNWLLGDYWMLLKQQLHTPPLLEPVMQSARSLLMAPFTR